MTAPSRSEPFGGGRHPHLSRGRRGMQRRCTRRRHQLRLLWDVRVRGNRTGSVLPLPPPDRPAPSRRRLPSEPGAREDRQLRWSSARARHS